MPHISPALQPLKWWLLEKSRFALAPFFQGIGSILALHRVVLDRRPLRLGWPQSLEMTPELLDDLLKEVKARYGVVSMDEVHEILTRRKRTPPFVAFTFDDGYRDNLTEALEVFQVHSAPFTVYLTSDFVAGKTLLWWYPLEEVVLERESIELAHGGQIRRFLTRTGAEKQAAFKALSGLFFRAGAEEKRALAEAVLGRSRVERCTSELVLGWDGARALTRSPLVTLGSHTVTHPVLSQLSDEEVAWELQTPREIIERECGVRVEHMAYPFGGRLEVGPRELRIAQEHGFKTAATTRSANLFFEHASHLQCLPRLAFGNHSLAQLRILLSGALAAFYFRGQRVITV